MLLLTYPTEDGGQFARCLFGKDFNQTDMGPSAEDCREEPLLLYQRDKDIFTHPLLERSAKIPFT